MPYQAKNITVPPAPDWLTQLAGLAQDYIPDLLSRDMAETPAAGLMPEYAKDWLQGLAVNPNEMLYEGLTNQMGGGQPMANMFKKVQQAASKLPRRAVPGNYTLWHGSDQARDIIDSVYSRGNNDILWFSPHREYSGMYGPELATYSVDIKKPFDIRSITGAIKGQTWDREKTVSEWIDELSKKGLDVNLVDKNFSDVPVKFWDLLHDADIDATRATNLLDALKRNNYDSIITREVGLDGRNYQAVGMLTDSIGQELPVPAWSLPGFRGLEGVSDLPPIELPANNPYKNLWR